MGLAYITKLKFWRKKKSLIFFSFLDERAWFLLLGLSHDKNSIKIIINTFHIIINILLYF